ncbi:MAG: M48 family metallopeptidase [bacterium]|nr:M48 family metallopeptidase [bacterium]
MRTRSKRNFTPVTIVFILAVSFSALVGQETGFFEDMEVVRFEKPFIELNVLYYGTELPIIIGKNTNIKGADKKNVPADELVEGTIIERLDYKLVGSQYQATEIQTNISSDGTIKIEGLYEGIDDEIAVIDGYKVKLEPGVKPEGKKGWGSKKCKCKGLVVPNFKTPLTPPGAFFITITGKMKDDGIIYAEEAELCRNTFGQPEKELLSSVNGHLTDRTNALSDIPSELASLNMNLYNGEIKVGQYSYKLTDDIELQGYVNKVGYRVLPSRLKKKQAEQGPVYYRFYVIDDPVPNAFAFPNGMIFVHTGLLEVMENEAQLAAVLGHEIAHVTHEHGRERYETNKLVDAVEGLAESVVGESLQEKLATLAPDASPDMVNSMFQLSNAITPAAISNVVKRQPKMEAQADRVGLYYAAEAGYDIREAAKFWDKMASLAGDQSFQARITNDLLGSLRSARLDFSNGNLTAQLSGVGGDLLAKQILDTIYTSHPKAKSRSRNVSKLVGTVYQNDDVDRLRVREKEYREAMGL